jgi:hypothetical protein
MKESLANKLQMWTLSWSAQIPDGDTFMGMFYGPNSGQEQRRALPHRRLRPVCTRRAA